MASQSRISTVFAEKAKLRIETAITEAIRNRIQIRRRMAGSGPKGASRMPKVKATAPKSNPRRGGRMVGLCLSPNCKLQAAATGDHDAFAFLDRGILGDCLPELGTD